MLYTLDNSIIFGDGSNGLGIGINIIGVFASINPVFKFSVSRIKKDYVNEQSINSRFIIFTYSIGGGFSLKITPKLNPFVTFNYLNCKFVEGGEAFIVSGSFFENNNLSIPGWSAQIGTNYIIRKLSIGFSFSKIHPSERLSINGKSQYYNSISLLFGLKF
ncbi:MAG: hypothetical protein HPY79_10695 [Bacteroidales bacterium]|nr:hypothetical protein [Bacteroidales bacterium]